MPLSSRRAASSACCAASARALAPATAFGEIDVSPISAERFGFDERGRRGVLLGLSVGHGRLQPLRQGRQVLSLGVQLHEAAIISRLSHLRDRLHLCLLVDKWAVTSGARTPGSVRGPSRPAVPLPVSPRRGTLGVNRGGPGLDLGLAPSVIARWKIGLEVDVLAQPRQAFVRIAADAGRAPAFKLDGARAGTLGHRAGGRVVRRATHLEPPRNTARPLRRRTAGLDTGAAAGSFRRGRAVR